MWTCPECHRSFKNTNQDHSCFVTDLESHFYNKDPNVKIVFEKILEEVLNYGDLSISSVKHTILFTKKSHFLVVKPKKKWLDIEFILPVKIEEFPIHKSVQVSKTKWAHFIRLESAAEVDEDLKEWIINAYELSK